MSQILRSPVSLPIGGKAQRVYLFLREEIARGVYSQGAAIPAEHKLAEQLEVSRVTVRRALEALDTDGLIVRRAGSGTTVRIRDDAPKVAADFSTLIPQLLEMEQATTARLLSFAYCAAPDKISAALNIPRGAPVQRAVRLRFTQGRPFSHLTTWVPEKIASSYTEADLATKPLFRLLEQSGIKVARANQQVTATLAAPDVAEQLGISVGAPLLALTRMVEDAQGQGVEYLSALYRPDMFQLEMELSREGTGDARHWQPVITSGHQEAGE